MGSHETTRRWLLGVGALAIGAGIGGPPAIAASSRPLPATTDSTAPADSAVVYASRPSVSQDGRWVVFAGPPAEAGDRTSTVYLRDTFAHDAVASDSGLASDEVVELTLPVPGIRLGDSVLPAISGDGCTVVATTEIAYDMFRDDDQGDRWDVYRLVLPQCGGQPDDWELVSTQNVTGTETSALDRASPTDRPAVSQSGSVVAFTQQAREGKDPLTSVTVVDLTVAVGDLGREHTVAGTPPEVPNTTFRYLGQRQPSLSSDGRFVAFTSDAYSDQPGSVWGEGPVGGEFATTQVYVWDRAAPDQSAAVTLVSGASAVVPTDPTAPTAVTTVPKRAPADAGAEVATISGNGRFVVFQSRATNLAGDAVMPRCAQQCPLQIYRYDQSDHSLRLVSAQPDPAGGAPIAADLGAWQASITSDGTQVGFATKATNFFPVQSEAGTGVDDGDIVVANVDLGSLQRISVRPDSTPAPATSSWPVLSADGDAVVFDTLSANAINGSTEPGRRVTSVSRPAHVVVPDLDVGTVVVTFPGPEWWIGVKNLGPSTFTTQSITSSNPDFAVTGGTCGYGLPLVPGDFCKINIVLTPSVEGPITGTLTVVGTGLHPVTVTAALSGQGGEPLLAPSPAGADFAPAVVGAQSPTVSFDINNVGFAIGTIASIEMAGADPTDFKVKESSCLGQAMIPGAGCAVVVAFTPKAAGYRTATVLITTDTGQYTSVLVNGVGSFVPKIAVADDVVQAGQEIGIGGSGFEPRSEVTIAWADGSGLTATVTTDSLGMFLEAFPTKRLERTGDRQIVVQGSAATLTASVRVVRRVADDGLGSPVWGS